MWYSVLWFLYVGQNCGCHGDEDSNIISGKLKSVLITFISVPNTCSVITDFNATYIYCSCTTCTLNYFHTFIHSHYLHNMCTYLSMGGYGSFTFSLINVYS